MGGNGPPVECAAMLFERNVVQQLFDEGIEREQLPRYGGGRFNLGRAGRIGKKGAQSAVHFLHERGLVDIDT
jgi:hypothetical protein